MRVHHLAISVRDLEKSVAFYKKLFGFEEIQRFTKPDWNGNAVVLQLNDLQLEIFQFKEYIENTEDQSNLAVLGIRHIGIEVDSVEEKHAAFKAQNVDISDPKKGTTCTAFCFLRDPDGISIELYQK